MGLTLAGRNAALTRLLVDSIGIGIKSISLHTADPGTDGANEVTGTGYERKSVTWDDFKNTNLIQLENTGATSWGTISYAGLWNSTTLIGTVALAVPKAALPGSIVAVPVGDLIASMTGLCELGRTYILAAITTGTVGRPAHIRLHTGDPGDTGAANLLTATGYAAAAVTWGAATSGASTNTNKPLWANNSGSAWPTVTHWSAGGTGGNGLAKGALTTPITLADGDMMEFPIGSIQISLT